MVSTTFILSDVRIFTGTDTIESGHVVIKDGLISAVSAGSPPADARIPVIPKPGHTVVPGFIDAHMHADKGQELALYQSLKFGVTTVMDMHNETANVHKLKKLAADKKDEAADFKAAGAAATIDGGWPMPVVTAYDKSEEARPMIPPSLDAELTLQSYRQPPKSQPGQDSPPPPMRKFMSPTTCRPPVALTTSS
jgi:dihydroorotase-like cyclic amidohydrolase